jgi:16S rRNA (cytidine1402-2'-O)-methyltransferase
VVPVPGPSAPIAALSGSGLPADAFFFGGFLPARGSARKRRLEDLASIPATLVLFEAPHRLLDSLEDMAAVLGPRRACVARELTKMHEEFLHGTIPQLLETLRARPAIRGEITLVIQRGEATEPESVFPPSIRQHLEEEMQRTGLPRNEALKLIAKKRGISRRDAYRELTGELSAAENPEQS